MAYSLEVGKRLPLFNKNIETLKGQECCVMELSDDGSFILLIVLPDMTFREEALLRENTIKTRIIERGDFIYPIIRFEKTDMMFEIDFDPFLYDEERIKKVGQSNMVNIVAVEGNDFIIKVLRWANMPKKLYSKYITNWNLANKEEYSIKYHEWTSKLKREYGVNELWNEAKYVGEFGER